LAAKKGGKWVFSIARNILLLGDPVSRRKGKMPWEKRNFKGKKGNAKNIGAGRYLSFSWEKKEGVVKRGGRPGGRILFRKNGSPRGRGNSGKGKSLTPLSSGKSKKRESVREKNGGQIGLRLFGGESL